MSYTQIQASLDVFRVIGWVPYMAGGVAIVAVLNACIF
jgi:hypothetical protein